MKRKRFTEEQIAAVLKQAELGVEVKDLCRKFGFTETTFYRWKKQYAGMGISEPRELRQTREENAKLKRIVAERDLEIEVMKEIAAKKW